MPINSDNKTMFQVDHSQPRATTSSPVAMNGQKIEEGKQRQEIK